MKWGRPSTLALMNVVESGRLSNTEKWREYDHAADVIARVLSLPEARGILERRIAAALNAERRARLRELLRALLVRAERLQTEEICNSLGKLVYQTEGDSKKALADGAVRQRLLDLYAEALDWRAEPLLQAAKKSDRSRKSIALRVWRVLRRIEELDGSETAESVARFVALSLRGIRLGDDQPKPYPAQELLVKWGRASVPALLSVVETGKLQDSVEWGEYYHVAEVLRSILPKEDAVRTVQERMRQVEGAPAKARLRSLLSNVTDGKGGQ